MEFAEKVEVVVKAVISVGLLALYAYCVVTQTPPPPTLDQLLLAAVGVYGVASVTSKVIRRRNQTNSD